jgi:hypothetical protein
LVDKTPRPNQSIILKNSKGGKKKRTKRKNKKILKRSKN